MGTWSLRRRLAVFLLTAAVGILTFAAARAQDGLKPGEAFLTQFSGTTVAGGVNVIDEEGVVGRAVDVSAPGSAPNGALADAPSRPLAMAGDVGQVFGIAIGSGD